MTPSSSAELLLVEDSPDHIELAMRVFQKLNTPLNIAILQDGEDALNYILGRGTYQDHPATQLKLILLDLYLPKVSGTEILRQIRMYAPTKDLPVAILSITGNERGNLENEPFNVHHYLRKPLELNDFLKLYNIYLKPAD